MIRRLTALAGMVLIVVLAVMLMWRVYLHHRQISVDEEPVFVYLSSPAIPA